MQTSVVQSLPSSQVGSPSHTPPVQTSPVVQKSPSSHAVPFGSGLLTHWLPTSSQLSAVQGLSSLQVAVPPVQLPPWHVSPVVQNRPSSQV